MLCKSCQCPAFGKPCVFCNEKIFVKQEYGFSEIKGATVCGVKVGKKKIYFHTKCYYDNTMKASK